MPATSPSGWPRQGAGSRSKLTALITAPVQPWDALICTSTAVKGNVERLFTSPELRRQMGEAGRTRARAVYDWAVIIPQYEALWAELDARRKKESPSPSPLAHPWPARMDPFCAFAAYPTQTLTQQTDPAERQAHLFRALVWLVKLGVLRVCA
jgi:hypothetical protein